MRLHTTLMTAALLGVAALPAAAQNVQQRINEEHAVWHQRHDRLARTDPAEYQREHAREHQELEQMAQRYSYNAQRYGYPQNGNGWYDSNGNWHPANQGGSLWDRILGRTPQAQRQGGYYDQNGNWHPYAQQQQGGYYDQNGNWHAYNNGVNRRDDDDRGRNPKAEGRHDNGKHNGEYRREHDNDHDN